MQKLLLKDATVVMPERILKKDILIEDKFIAKIDENIQDSGAREINCKDLLALPGAIDAHVHFRQPGMEHKATMFTESRAALLGGVTSYMDMPNTMPPCTCLEALEQKRAIAQKDSAANYTFHLGAGLDNIDEIERVDVTKVPSVKVYMGATTGNLLVDNVEKLNRIFKASPLMITTHCEDSNLIYTKEKEYKERYGDDIPFTMHNFIRNRHCCVQSARLAIQLALDNNAKLHIMHVSTKDEISLLSHFAKDDIQTRQISCEVCIPHLMFSSSDYDRLKGFLKCNPSVKDESDRLSLLDGIKRGIITTVGTDHAPHEKESKLNVYTKCPSGLPSVQFMLPALFDLWSRREIRLEQIARLSAYNVAKRYGIKGRGALVEGNYADIVLVNLLKGHKVTTEDIASKCQWSPFEGHRFATSVIHTFVNGAHSVENGVLTGNYCSMPLEFER